MPIGDEPVLGPCIDRLVSDMRLRWVALDERIKDLNAEFTEAARTDERARRLLTIPGIGALNATALVAAISDARTFRCGRRPCRMVRLGAWLRGLFSRSHHNAVVAALAAKMARIVWALLRHERIFDLVAQAA